MAKQVSQYYDILEVFEVCLGTPDVDGRVYFANRAAAEAFATAHHQALADFKPRLAICLKTETCGWILPHHFAELPYVRFPDIDKPLAK